MVDINGVKLNNIRYAYDTLLVTDNEEDLQNKKYGIKNNLLLYIVWLKTQYQRNKIYDIGDIDITVDGTRLKDVHKLVYLDSNNNDQCNPTVEIKTRMRLLDATSSG